MGDGFWTEAWNPRMPDSCLFSSPLAIELIDSAQRGWVITIAAIYMYF